MVKCDETAKLNEEMMKNELRFVLLAECEWGEEKELTDLIGSINACASPIQVSHGSHVTSIDECPKKDQIVLLGSTNYPRFGKTFPLDNILYSAKSLRSCLTLNSL